MQIYVTVNLAPSDEFAMTSEEAATAVLAALGGDVATDSCSVQLSVPPAVVGVDAVPAAPPTP